jgi:PEP-CTERM motif
MKISCRVVGLATAFLTTAAHADIITSVTSQSALNPNDSVNFSQLGSDGATIAQNTTVSTTGGRTVGLGFAGSAGGTVCDSSGGDCGAQYASDFGSGDQSAFSTFAVQSVDSSGSGTATGAITLTLPHVSAVGTTVLSDTAFQGYNENSNNTPYYMPFTASLSVFNGSTLLGTVSATSDSSADPVYLGAVDSSGANITSAIYSITAIGQAASGSLTSVTVRYNPSSGHVDPVWCSLVPRDSTNIDNILQCPQVFLNDYPVTVSPDKVGEIDQSMPGVFTLTDNGVSPATFDTDPNDLANLYIDQVDLVATADAISTPEPGSLTLLASGLIALAARRRRTAP